MRANFVERWRYVVGSEGVYLVSDQGRVWSSLSSRPLRPTEDSWGYSKVTLVRPARRDARVHALVMAAFVGPYPAGLEICHNNGAPSDNRLSNLRYDTHSSNVLDTIAAGRNVSASKGKCPQGHAYTPENTRLTLQSNGRPTRSCRMCNNDAAQRYRQRKRAETLQVAQ